MPFEVISSQSGLRVKSGPGWLSRTGLVAGATLAWTMVLTNGWPTSSVLFSSLFAFGLFALTLAGLLGVFPRRETVAVDVAHRQVEVTASALLLSTTEKIPCVDGTLLARTFSIVMQSWSVAPMCPACLLGANTDGLHAIREISSRSKARARGAMGLLGSADLR